MMPIILTPCESIRYMHFIDYKLSLANLRRRRCRLIISGGEVLSVFEPTPRVVSNFGVDWSAIMDHHAAFFLSFHIF